MLLIWNQLHLKEKAFRNWNYRNELDHKYNLDTRGRKKGSLGTCLLEQVVPLNRHHLTLEAEQTNCCKSNKHNLSSYQNTSVINLINWVTYILHTVDQIIKLLTKSSRVSSGLETREPVVVLFFVLRCFHNLALNSLSYSVWN